jgi:hypothetical protein
VTLSSGRCGAPPSPRTFEIAPSKKKIAAAAIGATASHVAKRRAGRQRA